MPINLHSALVERPVACSGKGQYIALVYFGSKGGHLHHKTVEYSRKDPRAKDDALVLREVSRMIPARYRPYIVAISIVKRCLHPKSPEVAKRDRKPHYERVFSWVVTHAKSIKQKSEQAKRDHLEDILAGQKVQSVRLPYTQQEIRDLPVKQVITTEYWPDAHAAISLRGIERTAHIADVVA